MLHIFIVSLKQDVEKRETISKVLNDFDLDFTFVDAVYGKELPDSYLETIRNKSAGLIVSRGFAITPGEIGCTLSHIKTYHEVLSRGLRWACILEDDAILDSRFQMFIENFESTQLNPKSLYLLGGQTPSSKKNIVKSIKNVQNIGFQKFYKTIGSEDIIYRTCCYLVSSDLAKSLISLGKDELILADDWAYLLKKSIIESIYLSDFVEHPIDLSDSNIQKERDVASRIVKSQIKRISLGRRVKNSMQFRLKRLAIHLYKYIEPRDRWDR